MKITKKLLYTLILSTVFISCSNDDDSTVVVRGDYDSGILVSNEGPFNNGTGTITFISDDYTVTENKVFHNVNGNDIGNIVQSIGFSGDNAYIIVNNSNQIKVVNRFTFTEIATINTGLDNPRYFVAVGSKGYVTNWGDTADDNDDFIAVIDLNSNTVTSTIDVVLGPESIVYNGTSIYVAHKGAYGQNNQISVINPVSDEIETTITVGDVPISLGLNGNDLWVLCEGSPSYAVVETNGSLLKINTATNTTSTTINFATTSHPNAFAIDGSDLFYALDGEVYKMNVADNELPDTSIISGSFYRLLAKGGRLYATDAVDYASNGTLTIFDLSNNSEISSINVGVIPGGIYFNE